MSEEKKTDDHEGSAATSGKNPLLVVLVLVNTLAVCAIGFFQFQNHKKLNSVTTAADVMQQELAGGEHGGGEPAAAGGEHGAPAAGGEHGGAAGAAPAVKTDGLMYPIDPFTANLAQGEGPKRYIRISLVLKFTKDTKKEEVDSRKPQISDAIISMLNAKKPEELLKREGKDYLKEEIKTAINNFMIDGHLEDIYYVGFQIN
ncbi:flagellar basal body-associated FliL family protein [Bacteriovorax sp. PP10]|uniref:Flagellar protein FliL n=1 Tax=Bacteriovorax antarcticus TaxID=3088717 RepID=A0ABU5VSR9_9BACT|nr:flagellar basal body-associated FliL family protein [Bacteriovorax sp. PP10]MEA9355433.1 flagellar basal body-associated FliL family protein [Bacteriovorax sp. PP10]